MVRRLLIRPEHVSHFSRRSVLKLGLSCLGVPLIGRTPQFANGRPGGSPDRSKPNILFIVFDTLSARHLSLYGYRRRTTPNLERFAARATVFHAHYAAGNFTTPGTTSLLTGTYPWSHRAIHLWGTASPGYQDQNIFSALEANGYLNLAYTHNPLVTLLLDQFSTHLDLIKPTRELSLLNDQFADLLIPADYSIAYQAERNLLRPPTQQPSSLFLSLLDQARRFGLKSQLTAEYADRFPRGLPNHHGFQFFLVEDTVDWVVQDVLPIERPHFAYIHLWPPHHPYNPRREFIGAFDDGWSPPVKPEHHFSLGYHPAGLSQLSREYDEYISYVDAEFGRLYDAMARSGALDNTILVFTSDHGELFERGIFQHLTPTLYESIIRIPLLISVPGQARRVDVESPTSCIDVLPTLMHLIGAQIPSWCEGEVLAPFAPVEPDPERPVYALEAKMNSKWKAVTVGTAAIVTGADKLVHYFGYKDYEDVFELYSLADDPEELSNLDTERPNVLSSLRDQLAASLELANGPYR